ncbi:MAG: 7-carboxy-7-deazaguanine synthase [Saprospiraceae bacterium]|nr:7-carboxy-7-deazaguanine synthase [Saprospiraceae bacterium]
MLYTIREIFYTLQGEGAQSGRPAVFLRFTGCNFWNGKEEDRASAICNFCDTDFIGIDGSFGGKYNSKELVEVISSLWPDMKKGKPYVVCTGGEPLLQLDDELIEKLHLKGFEVGVETNGSIKVPNGIDWICMSPKNNENIMVHSGDELKFIFPQTTIKPEDFSHLDFSHFYIQAMDGPDKDKNLQLAIDFCLNNPQWKHSLQSHKIIGLR